ncbi:branched-chain-amino-acid aminotransferase, cytosolic-like isoform X1 [Lates japonicus]|uniref:Branched-chain-amino-acid aminotransferase n=1 Tax=Lates japonicus TaxID=270547 RepID=A0AAD3NKF1_LATJO|nr:branched-chain-amino-acid aminotransferase, cytosolic-like isoform X1 [Lates japonicus]
MAFVHKGRYLHDKGDGWTKSLQRELMDYYGDGGRYGLAALYLAADATFCTGLTCSAEAGLNHGFRWSVQTGYHSAGTRISFQALPFSISSLRFASSFKLFEGMKAFRGVDNHIRLFRPMLNMERMHRSADRSCLPLFDKGELLECIRKLVEVDQEWVPYSQDASLYIRPTFIGTEPSLGVSRAGKAMIFVIVGPVGPYFATGSFNPVSLLADPSFVRAWRGGVGAYKMGGNYGPTISVQNEAVKQGCQQVLWLYGEQEEITEVGTMNLFIYWTNDKGERELVTPPLDGIILPGVTRQSLLDLARTWGEFKVTERTRWG